MESGSITAGGRARLQRSPGSRSIDPIVQYTLTSVAALFLLLIGYFFVRLFVEAKPAFDAFGYFGFALRSNWDVAHNIYGAAPLLVGSVICSAIALVVGVPVAVSTAIYVTEYCPER